MGFSGIGIWEILLILVVALLVLGPNRIPEIARTLGRTIRAIRKASADLTATVSRELEADKKEPPPGQPTGSAEAPTPTTGATTPGQPDQPEQPGGASTLK